MTASPSASHPNRRAYNWLLYRFIDAWLIRSSRFIRGTVVDLGAGSAPYRSWISARCDRYVTVDWKNSLHAGEHDVAADLNGPIPIEGGVADCVISIAVMEHLREPQMMLGEAYRLLRPGSTVLLHVPFQWWVHEAPHDYFRYTPFALKMMFDRAGFEEVRVEPAGGVFVQFALKTNYLLGRLARGPALMQHMIRLGLVPLWCGTQCAALLLDRMDRVPELETVGYFVTARRPFER